MGHGPDPSGVALPRGQRENVENVGGADTAPFAARDTVAAHRVGGAHDRGGRGLLPRHPSRHDTVGAARAAPQTSRAKATEATGTQAGCDLDCQWFALSHAVRTILYAVRRYGITRMSNEMNCQLTRLTFLADIRTVLA